MATDNSIDLAISNPAFEIWLLMHFRGSPGAHHRDKVRHLLAERLPSYDKSVDFTKDYAADYDQAVVRARRMNDVQTAANSPGGNASTGVWLLTESIRT